MKILPAPGYALLQIVKEDFQSEAGIIIPDNSKNTSFFNRMKIVAMGKNVAETAIGGGIKYSIGDVVVISAAGAQIAVPGLIKNKESNWVDVILVPQGQIIATIKGDTAKDWEKGRSRPMIVPPTSNIN